MAEFELQLLDILLWLN